MYSIDIFFYLFCSFRGSKPTCTRTQNRKKKPTKKWPNRKIGLLDKAKYTNTVRTLVVNVVTFIQI
jgi:hypothetical protein